MNKHIACLDGIRGSLAMWVFWGHVSHAIAFHVPILEAPGMAVDLFMLLSGFLMAWHWRPGRGDEPSTSRRVFAFWIRRFFRIAPLYYPLFVVAVLLTPTYFSTQESMHAVYPFPWMPEGELWAAPSVEPFAPANLFAHFTFAFGLVPKFAANNPLPDWSIGLEMQFYLVFPLLAALLPGRRVWLLLGTALALWFVNGRLFGLYMQPGLLGTFPQPSFILFKLHVFVAGMALGTLAADLGTGRGFRPAYALVFALPLLLLEKVVAFGAVAIAVLVLVDRRPTRLVRDLLGTKPFRVLGDVSYGVYLVHTMPLYFVLHALHERGAFEGLAPWARFALAVTILTPLVVSAAWILHRTIELPGIALGRRLARRVLDREATSPGHDTPAARVRG
ncbi:acyltransferase [Opitutales bacterium ASA1]|uniref:acyltransferase family protein n=1 Tax=Congregicoccus parvus TaxID=3081749 RepID=UPI002B2A24D9|nr:acyltransferase [Opitutales bacterium ASA1]